MAQTKVKDGLLNFPDRDDFIQLPSGTTAQRPSSPEQGYSRYNTTDNKLEYWNGTEWQQLPGLTPPIITSLSYPGDDLAADPVGGQTITINGSNFLTGATVTIGGTTPSVITFVSATEITFEAPAKAAGDYDVVVTNVDGGNATSVDGMSYNGVPSWTTAAGNLGTFLEETSIPTITLVATEPDSGTISYSVTTGALPSGLTLSGSNITGTAPSVSGETTYNFSVTASDDENQSTERAFNIVVFKEIPSFNTVLYTGNDSTQSVTGVGFKPDWVWLMGRNVGRNYMYAELNGNIEYGVSSNIEPWYDAGNALTSFDSDGFTLGDNFGSNEGGINYVAWCWRAGSSVTGIGTGGISNVVQKANKEAGFSLITYFGNNAAGTLTHGLDSTPELTIAHRTSGGNSGWDVCGNFGGLQYGVNRLRLEDTSAITPDTNEIVGADSTTISVSTSSVINQGNIIMFAFHSVPGFSSFNGYSGTGASGNFQDCGFEPAFVVIKRATGGTEQWNMYDNKRNTNPSFVNKWMSANEGAGEYTNSSHVIAFSSTGFSFVTASANINASGSTYIYMAFANQF